MMSSAGAAVQAVYASPPAAAPCPTDDAEAELAHRKRPFLHTAASAAAADTCKKRRKQATPIRISSTAQPEPECMEGKEQQPPHPLDIKLEHSPSPTPTPSPIPVNLSGGQNFPSWLSDVQSTSASSSLPPSHNFYVPVPVNRPPSSSTHQQQQQQPPIRIFNPEAYCELCNKEFCNKYFLKTHKANKHRIYTDPPCSSDAVNLTPVNVPSYTASVPMSVSIPVPVPVPVPVPIPMPVLKKPDVPISADFLAHHLCDLCAKTFPSKMLLKAHRITVHGATTDPDLDPDPLPLDSVQVKEERERERELDVPDITASVMDKDPMLYKDESLVNQLSTMDQEENSENIAPLNSQQNRDNLDFTINRSRRLGIMNPEAFCEICCKEYCNKYFLRTHKMKRHGILIPDENSKDNQKDFKLELSISNNWYQIQTSPLNLIMGEQNTNSSGSCSERKSSPANENECEICGMRFQTVYLAQLHFATAHSQAQPQIKPNVTDDFSAVLSANNNDKQVPDSISEDLQKLQTMILQLNDLDVSKVAAGNSTSTLSTCTMCSKEFENRYYLHAHLMTEHGLLLENNSQLPQADMDNASELNSDVQPNTDNQFKLTHNTSLPIPSSGLMDKKDDSNGFMGPDKSMRTNNTNGNNSNSNSNSNALAIGSERRSSVTMTPANSYCEICNKELCNKYFMKTHMQRMHGIEIENGAQIGGVVCNICNKELCSKYFLRVHKHNTHGIVQDNLGGSTSNPRQSSSDLEQSTGAGNTVSNNDISVATSGTGTGTGTSDASLKLGDLSDLSNRYFTHFTEVCTICSRRFRSTKWLKAHLLGDHGKAGTEKWNELEMQLQQSFTQQQQMQSRKNITERTSPTLRIPNGGHGQDIKAEAGMHNVLSSIFGTDESNVKQYHCSFCSFSTPVLAFLFVHERSHSRVEPPNANGGNTTVNTNTNTNTNTVPSAISPLYCAVCNQSFRQPEQLHHHIVTQHTFLSFFGNVRQPTPTADMPKHQEEIPECGSCGRVKMSTDISITLQEVSKQRQLPASYALPQSQSQSQSQLKAKYTMQAFLLDEQSMDSDADAATGTIAVASNESNGDETEKEQQTETTADRRFAPSIVFLPVLEKLTSPMTVSFTLTPA